MPPGRAPRGILNDRPPLTGGGQGTTCCTARGPRGRGTRCHDERWCRRRGGRTQGPRSIGSGRRTSGGSSRGSGERLRPTGHRGGFARGRAESFPKSQRLPFARASSRPPICGRQSQRRDGRGCAWAGTRASSLTTAVPWRLPVGGFRYRCGSIGPPSIPRWLGRDRRRRRARDSAADGSWRDPTPPGDRVPGSGSWGFWNSQARGGRGPRC